jgi:methylmalonyl-CoA/ethylmalonyl-CoA epimerase
VFITLPNTRIALLAPLGADSPIAKLLGRNPDPSAARPIW